MQTTNEKPWQNYCPAHPLKNQLKNTANHPIHHSTKGLHDNHKEHWRERITLAKPLRKKVQHRHLSENSHRRSKYNIKSQFTWSKGFSKSSLHKTPGTSSFNLLYKHLLAIRKESRICLTFTKAFWELNWTQISLFPKLISIISFFFFFLFFFYPILCSSIMIPMLSTIFNEKEKKKKSYFLTIMPINP